MFIKCSFSQGYVFICRHTYFSYKIYNYVQIMKKLNKIYFLCTNVDYLKQINNNENLCLIDFFLKKLSLFGTDMCYLSVKTENHFS